jgi:4a-hydroxytetrahydrobiopterin dehydratase
MREPLSDDQITESLAELPGWRHSDEALQRRFTFEDFRQAVAFMVRVAFEAEQRDHHPELTNVYNRVDVALTTHDAGNRVTAKDVELARAIQRLA